MPILASDVVESARDLHPTFDDNTHPDLICVRFLDRYQRELLGEALTRYPSLYSATESIAIPLDDFAAGYALTTPFFVDDLVGARAGCSDTPIPIVPYEHRNDAQPHLYAYLVNRTLFLGRKASYWSSFDSLTVRYASTPPAVVALESPLALPDPAISALTYALSEFMAARPTQRTDVAPPDVSYFGGKHQEARETFLRQLWLLRSADSRFIRDVS